MNDEHEYTLHPFEEREFRDRFFPALYGNNGEGIEDIVRELLDAANAAGPSWTALHKLFDETRVSFKQAVETEDGGIAARTAFPAFARFLAHLRPAYTSRGFGLTSIDRREFPELASRISSGGKLLLRDGQPLDAVGPLLPTRVPNKCLPGTSAGGVVLKDDVRPLLDQFRKDLPRLAEWATQQGLPAEEGLTMILLALVHAKLQGCALIEGSNVLEGDVHVDKGHRLTYDRRDSDDPSLSRYFPFAVKAEAARAFGRELSPPQPEAPPPAPEPAPRVTYSPQGTYEVGQTLDHKAFGQGEVVAILDSRRLRVQFAEEEKTLIQGLKPAD